MGRGPWSLGPVVVVVVMRDGETQPHAHDEAKDHEGSRPLASQLPLLRQGWLRVPFLDRAAEETVFPFIPNLSALSRSGSILVSSGG